MDCDWWNEESKSKLVKLEKPDALGVCPPHKPGMARENLPLVYCSLENTLQHDLDFLHLQQDPLFTFLFKYVYEIIFVILAVRKSEVIKHFCFKSRYSCQFSGSKLNPAY